MRSWVGVVKKKRGNTSQKPKNSETPRGNYKKTPRSIARELMLSAKKMAARANQITRKKKKRPTVRSRGLPRLNISGRLEREVRDNRESKL